MHDGSSLERRAGAAVEPVDLAVSALAAWSAEQPAAEDCELVVALAQAVRVWMTTNDDRGAHIASLLARHRDGSTGRLIFRAAGHAACYDLYAQQPRALTEALRRLDALEATIFPDARTIFPLGRTRSAPAG